jgi:hypothetical protein
MQVMDALSETDPLCEPFLEAADEDEAENQLAHLLEVEAAPVIEAVFRRKLGRGIAGDPQSEAADLTSAVREELIARLLAARRGETTRRIAHFRAYVAAVAYSVWAQRLRAENPARCLLLNRLRYLLENRTTQHGFSIWDGPGGERWCGFRRWSEHGVFSATVPKVEWLLIDPAAAARQALGARSWKTMNLAELVAGLFTWLGCPIELRNLLHVLTKLLEISDEKQSWNERSPERSEDFTDPAASPVDALKWREYLRWLWSELGRLSLPQRTAFLLHADLLRELDFGGIASVRQMAAPLAMSPEELAGLWNSIPLEDFAIARRLGLERQQVINLRRVARDRLGAAWRKWIT